MSKKANSEEQLPQEPGSPDLASRLHEVKGIDEDIAEIIVQNWRQVVIAAVALIAGVWLVNEYRSGAAERRGAVAKEFIEAQELFSKIKEEAPKAQDEAEQPAAEAAPTPEQEAEKQKQIVALQEKLRSVSETAEGSFYPDAAKLYNAIDLLKAQKVADALTLLKSFPITRYESKQQNAVASGDKIAENLLNEFAALLYSKALLQQETPDIETARRYLIGLSYQAHLLNVEAVLTLARISIDDNQRQETKTVAHDITVGRPELAESIETAISPYGIEIN